MYIHISRYVCLCVCVCMYMYMHVYTQPFTYLLLNVYIHVYISLPFLLRGAYVIWIGYLSGTIGYLSDFDRVPIANLSQNHRVPIQVPYPKSVGHLYRHPISKPQALYRSPARNAQGTYIGTLSQNHRPYIGPLSETHRALIYVPQLKTIGHLYRYPI